MYSNVCYNYYNNACICYNIICNCAWCHSNDVISDATRLLTGISNGTINEHDNFSMVCVVEGRPHPLINWWFSPDDSTEFSEVTNNDVATVTTSTKGQSVRSEIVLLATPRGYHGYYKCNSSNILGGVESAAFVTVNCTLP